jgi:serine/threonine-protein kinase
MTPTKRSTLKKGARIQGKWSKQEWTVCSCLGVGANGVVYSVRRPDGEVAAMKICDEAGSVAFEWSLLEKMAQSGAAFPKPHCIDDSAQAPALYFYVMEQINGRPLAELWQHLQGHDIKRVLLAIGSGLRALHRIKHAFCDVKPQNLLVDLHREQCVRFVDVGGVTPFGRSVRQFTPTSDCAYWGFGERRATEKYDIAAVALMLVCLRTTPPSACGNWTEARRRAWVQAALRQYGDPETRSFLEDAISGRIATADEWILRVDQLSASSLQMARSNASLNASSFRGWRAHGPQRQPKRPVGAQTTATQTKASPSARPSAQHRVGWTERFMWASLCCAVVSTFSAWAVYLHWL